MCGISEGKLFATGLVMEGVEFLNYKGILGNFSVLLELSASDDLVAFRSLVEEGGYDVDEVSYWYGRRIGSKKMAFEERTPLMIAAVFGSKKVLGYIIETGRADINRASGSDGATALHCAVAGGSVSSPDVVKCLLDACANPESIDANGNRPGDLITPAISFSFNLRRKMLELTLKSGIDGEQPCLLADQSVECKEEHFPQILSSLVSKDGIEKKEYPVDLSLPDIKNGVYGTDEFRMYIFKVKPCSRAYSHDWTECPFVHPGENARRRDPRKYHYSCVPCPEFRKGSCRQGDACEYAHGIFECWLHPAQYRTRLCKDEVGCARRVCFFAHKPEELRPLYASTGSGLPSPRSFSNSNNSLEMTSINPFGSSSVLIPPNSTPPMSPSGGSSPMGGTMWQNQANIMPPNLQLPVSRLKTSFNARDRDLDMELTLERHRRQQQFLMEEMSSLSSPTSWNNNSTTSAAFSPAGERSWEVNGLGGVKPTNLDDMYGAFDPAILPQLQGFSLDSSAAAAQIQSPNGAQARQIMNQQLRSSYPTSVPSSNVRSPFGVDSTGAASAAAAAAVMNSRSAAFAKRSQSFIDRSPVNRNSGLSSPVSSENLVPYSLSNWGSPDGKLDWGIQKEELNKLRKSSSFGLRSSANNFGSPRAVDEPDASWAPSMVKETQPVKPHRLFSHGEEDQAQQCHLNSGGSEVIPQWVDQFYLEQEQMVA